MPSVLPVSIRPLVQGERVPLADFERRYAAMPEPFWAELVDGVVHLDRNDGRIRAGRARLLLTGWLGRYVIALPSLECGTRSSIRLDSSTVVQPAAFLAMPASSGGRLREDADGFLDGVPEFVVETCPDAADLNLHGKLAAYERNGVREYVVWRTHEAAVDWFDLRQGRLLRRSPDADGLIRSRIFPGLWLDPDKFVALDRVGLAADLQVAFDTPEHKAFVERLTAP